MSTTDVAHPHGAPDPPRQPVDGGAADGSGERSPAGAEPGLWSPEKRQLTVGMVLTITLVAFEALAIATIMPDVKDDLGGLQLYGWVISGFFLSSLLGIVVAGYLADRQGIALPFVGGLVLFAAGLIVGGAATSMGMLLVGRMAQGFGAGAIPAAVYVAVGRGYAPSQRPKMFAVLSTAWVVPGLIAPGAAALIDDAFSWRWVFLGLLPIVVVAAVMALPPLIALGAPARGVIDPEAEAAAGRSLWLAVALGLGLAATFSVGAGVVLPVAVPLAVVGLPVALWALVRLLPAGTLRLAPGSPAAVAVRGILTWGFFAADAFVALAVVDGRGGSTLLGGEALSVGAFTWAGASWVQARVIDRVGPRVLARIGFVLIVIGELGMIAVAQGALPVVASIPVWAVGCAGIGTVYAPLALTVLGAARPGEEGAASAAIQLTDGLGIFVGTAVSGWIVSAADHAGHSVATSTTVVFVVAAAVSTVGIVASGRLPKVVPTPESP
jgi:MFS family permease